MDEKKLEIIERASAVYMKFGIKSVTMDDLARELGISKKTIYKYFNDKNHLVKSIIEMKTQMDQALCVNCMQNSDNAIDDMIEITKLIIEHFSNMNPIVFSDLKKYHADAWSVIEKHKWQFVKSVLKENIENGKRQGLYRADVNSDIVSTLHVIDTDALMDGKYFSWPEFKFQDLFVEFIRFQLFGLANDKGREYLKSKLDEINV